MTDLLKRAEELQLQIKNDERMKLLGKNKSVARTQNLFQKQKLLDKADEEQQKRYMFLLDREKAEQKEKADLFRKTLEGGVEFMQLGRKKQHIPVEVISVDKLEVDGDVPKNEKILHYAKKYRIPFSMSGEKKSFGSLERNIRKFEKKNLIEILHSGKDKRFSEYGLFIKHS